MEIQKPVLPALRLVLKFLCIQDGADNCAWALPQFYQNPPAWEHAGSRQMTSKKQELYNKLSAQHLGHFQSLGLFSRVPFSTLRQHLNLPIIRDQLRASKAQGGRLLSPSPPKVGTSALADPCRKQDTCGQTDKKRRRPMLSTMLSPHVHRFLRSFLRLAWPCMSAALFRRLLAASPYAKAQLFKQRARSLPAHFIMMCVYTNK